MTSPPVLTAAATDGAVTAHWSSAAMRRRSTSNAARLFRLRHARCCARREAPDHRHQCRQWHHLLLCGVSTVPSVKPATRVKRRPCPKNRRWKSDRRAAFTTPGNDAGSPMVLSNQMIRNPGSRTSLPPCVSICHKYRRGWTKAAISARRRPRGPIALWRHERRVGDKSTCRPTSPPASTMSSQSLTLTTWKPGGRNPDSPRSQG